MTWLRANWDRAAGWTLVPLGVVLLFVGWDHVSETGYPAEQIPYLLSAGVGGALCIGFGAALLLSADLRDLWHKIDGFEEGLDVLRRRLDGEDPALMNGAVPGDGSRAGEPAVAGDDADSSSRSLELHGRPGRRRRILRPAR
jgi:hypothetical protein